MKSRFGICNTCDLALKLQKFFSMASEESNIAEILPPCPNSEKLWTDVPADLLHSISSQLIAADFAAFQAVCKSWKSSTNAYVVSPPCLMFNNDALHHPVCNSTIGIGMYQLLNYGCIRCSNYSWLLVNTSHCDMYVFNPFTNVKVELPPLNLFISLHGFSFSAPPTSPDCTLFCMATPYYQKIAFFILKRGENEWTIRKFDDLDDDFDSNYGNSLLYKGNYYCLGEEGDLLVYDVEKNEPRLINSAISFLQNRLSTKRCQSFIAESNGDLLAVFMSCVMESGYKSVSLTNPE